MRTSSATIAIVLLFSSISASAARRASPARTRERAPTTAPQPAVAPAQPLAPVQPIIPQAPELSTPIDPSKPQVVAVSSRRVYVNRGLRDGLAAGATISFSRAGKAVSKCVVEFVSASRAACVGDGLKIGDVFVPPGGSATTIATPRAKVVDARFDEELQRLRAVDQALVPFGGVESSGERTRALEATISHLQWGGLSGGNALWERVDVAIGGLPLAGGFRLNARATAIAFPSRPATSRYLPDSGSALWVREFAVSQREADRAWTLSAGRLAPQHVPGLVVMDGAQAGLRVGKASEIGAFGGFLPESIGLAPSLTRWTAGAYYASQLTSDGDVWRTLQHEGRVGVTTAADGSQLLQAQLAARAAVTSRLDASTDVRVDLASGALALGAFRFDLSWRPVPSLRFVAGVRQLGATQVFSEAGLLGTGPLRHGDLLAMWDLSDVVNVGLDGGAAQDVANDLARAYVGPTLGLPRLFGERGGMSVGYREEFGWMGARSTWVQANVLVSQRLAVYSRLSWAYNDLATLANDLGLLATADARLLDWLALRATAQLRLGAGFAGASAPGYVVGLAFVLKRGL